LPELNFLKSWPTSGAHRNPFLYQVSAKVRRHSVPDFSVFCQEYWLDAWARLAPFTYRLASGPGERMIPALRWIGVSDACLTLRSLPGPGKCLPDRG
jgi:hypothetical protein